MAIETSLPIIPIRAFHAAPFSVTDLFLPGLMTVMAAVPLLGLPIKGVLNPYAYSWPEDAPLLFMWLAGSGALIWFVVMPMLATWQRVRAGEPAGLSIAEGDDHVEVAFFAGGRAWRVQRFAYADIIGCGVDRFPINSFGHYEARPYVAVRGSIRSQVKIPIPLAILYDARALRQGDSHDIAADLQRVISRHCQPVSP